MAVSILEKTHRNVIDPHAAQGPPVITEVILNGRICHLQKNEKFIYTTIQKFGVSKTSRYLLLFSKDTLN